MPIGKEFGDHTAGLIEWINQLHAGEVKFNTVTSSFFASFLSPGYNVSSALNDLGDATAGLISGGGGGGSGTFLIDDGDSLLGGVDSFDDGDST